jgi:hypothetical protein
VGSAGPADPRVAPFAPSFVQVTAKVGLKVGMVVLAVFLAYFRGEVGPWIRVLAPDWLKVCFHGSMRCHGHMGSCVASKLVYATNESNTSASGGCFCMMGLQFS